MHNIQEYTNHLLKQRIERLEEKIFGNKKRPITLNQQILALEHLGIIQIIRELKTSNAKKAELLSIIIRADESNTKKAIEALARKNDDLVKTIPNYEYLLELFSKVGLSDDVKQLNTKIIGMGK